MTTEELKIKSIRYRKNILKYILILFFVIAGVSCSKDYGNLNGPSVEGYLENATSDQLNNLVTGTESALRNNLSLYLDDIGVIGREIYRISGSEPRFTTDLRKRKSSATMRPFRFSGALA